VARRYALNASLIFKWLRDPRFAPAAAIEEASVFLPADVREDVPVPAAPPVSAGGDARGQVAGVLATGHRVTVRGLFDGDATARVLTVPTRA
jgi:transposase